MAHVTATAVSAPAAPALVEHGVRCVAIVLRAAPAAAEATATTTEPTTTTSASPAPAAGTASSSSSKAASLSYTSMVHLCLLLEKIV